MHLPSHRRVREPLEVKMTPMIDVIFLLLIFFVCTASFQISESVLPTNLALPGQVASEVAIPPELQDLDEVVIRLLWEQSQPAWSINNRRWSSLAEVAGLLKGLASGLGPDVPVILDVDKPVPMEHVIDVYDACRRAGLEKIQFAADAAP